ncbi:Uncharacterized protein ALO43_03458 [Pseudomonas tremae]|jgi:hypothetical protein|uniref:Uncharacterized protein n=1 Tax=Pseudomonas tremae TaxID=200454 RepID=A0AA40P0A9_9PSED|nr:MULTISPECIES: hypothetical protein [Pseudomonas]KPY92323.1 Uncharacterized protein ALO43_03458 [Pseudomonas tremae]MBP1122052.1 hypothetical protein [Pseudomonas sp. PvP028]RMO02945.1 hypothetical protein ALQ48_04055 [Pseudomonas coronafaciens pv. zizaniae]
MSPFARIVTDLLKGGFICQVTDYEGYQFLSSPQASGSRTNQDDVDDYLRRINIRLTQTRSGSAFFAAASEIDSEGKKIARRRFGELKNSLRPMVSFLEMVMRLEGDDDAVSPGQKLDLNRTMAKIAANAGIGEQLRQIASDTNISTRDGSDRERLNKIVKRFRDDGYLQLVNPESEIYVFTGRIEWLMEAIEYLMLHDQISDDDKEFDKRTAS